MGGTSLRKFKQLSTGHCCIHRKNGEDPPTPTIPVRLPSHNGPTKSSGPRFTDCWIGGHLSLSKGRMQFNQSGQVQEDIKGLLEQATKIWELRLTSVWSSLSFPSWLLPFMGPVITILLRLLFGACILQLLTKFISSRLQQFQAKLMLLQGQKLVSNVEHPNLDRVERHFYSARQAYAHAQQKEVTEERDLHPNSQEVS